MTGGTGDRAIGDRFGTVRRAQSPVRGVSASTFMALETTDRTPATSPGRAVADGAIVGGIGHNFVAVGALLIP